MNVACKSIVCLAAAIALPVESALADVLSETQTVSNAATTPWFNTPEGGQHTFAQWNPTVTFAQFDPSLGTLVGVTITVQTGMTNLLNLIGYNPQQNPTAFGACTYSLEWSASITPPGTTVIPEDHRLRSETFGTTLGLFVQSTFTRPPSGNSVPSTYTVAPADFSLYSGTGTAPFSLTFDAGFDCTSLLNCSAMVRLTSRATITVEYEYTPVPSPAAAATLLLGGVAASRRRRG